ncbi:MAG: prepilin-type N-terminal cleavage/methylation domain-containing protein [Gammaproteobacteria bacterium]|nr:prepilin-type N-terminal cleavage/methylation domain-containing protein [Gammaproteobacteria bacterium]
MYRQGFSITEILVAVAVVGVTIGIAIPLWQAAELRKQVDNGLAQAEGRLVDVAHFYRDRGRLPRHSGELGLVERVNDHAVEYLSWRRSSEDPERVGYLDVQMTLQPLGAGMTPIALEARVADGQLRWRCVSARRLGVAPDLSLSDFYLPSRCRQGGESTGP